MDTIRRVTVGQNNMKLPFSFCFFFLSSSVVLLALSLEKIQIHRAREQKKIFFLRPLTKRKTCKTPSFFSSRSLSFYLRIQREKNAYVTQFVLVFKRNVGKASEVKHENRIINLTTNSTFHT